MYTVDLILALTHCAYEDISWDCEQWLGILASTNQIINREYQLIRQEDQLRIPVTCPEPDSLAAHYCNQQALHYLDRLQTQTHHPLRVLPTGVAADSVGYQVPLASSYYILNGEKSFSPVVCGDTYQPIPLYRLPYTTAYQSYQDINSWQWTYQSLAELWRINDRYETYALSQLQQVESPLSRQGQALCQHIEQLTGVPTYYFLTNRRCWSETKDRNWKCPLTGKDWLLPDKTFNDYIAFRCDASRLVSELSSMVSSRSRKG